ncbi:NifB/NifX family molybdenum-iron cluster-binding protein [Wukongibacter baidiensis]|uniref:NifB/NifX family molybdenum-iron cluster-binding protein n=1 Tax=Wukongibacter baidiensis TaxID=1723361 RepID=UPI003D7FBE67
MKICITSTGADEKSPADFRFGRCKYFAIYDDKEKEIEFVLNPGVEAQQGAGITSAQRVIDMGLNAVVTGNIGPNAMRLLNASNIKVYGFGEGTVEEVLKAYMDKNLTEITTPVPSHFGMGNKHMHGRGRR